MKAPKDLGLDVKLEVKKMENDKWAQAMLAEIGKTIGPRDLQYQGSACVHIYTSKDSALIITDADNSAATIEQSHDLPALVSPKLANFAIQSLANHVASKYGVLNRHRDQNVKGQDNIGG